MARPDLTQSFEDPVMSSHPTPAPRSLFLRFCDNFLQERNIKWMLAVGMLILLGSSVLLVSAHWDTFTPVWKYVTFLTYTGAIFGVAQWTRFGLGLRRTGTGLQVLTVLLLPITFLVLHWVQRQTSGTGEIGFRPDVLGVGLLGINLGFSVYAARRIFQHFLRGHQPTFLISYLILALAGALVPALPQAWAPVVALALWAVFAAGSVKVNRHVFWLTEERRAPRVFGFLPILLLGVQFLALFALLPKQISLDWLGFGCVLMAVPVLLTADVIARVFQQRTGDLVRPLPWSIIGPLVLGLVLCAAGVCLAATGVIPPSRPHALALTSALAAGMMALMARRTGKQGFVWAMLAGVVLAYNFSPAFFIDLARTVLNQAAHVVHEQRLPYAFYGLTYLPLLLGLMVIGRKLTSAGNQLFARPIRVFAVALGCIMLAISVGHVKAVFPVALCMTLAFGLQVALFRDGRLALLGVVAWIAAAIGLVPFVQTVLGWTLPADPEVCFLAVAAGLLLVAGRIVDPRIARFIRQSLGDEWWGAWPGMWQRLCRNASLAVAIGLAVYAFIKHAVVPFEPAVCFASLLLLVLLAVHARLCQRPEVRQPLLILMNWHFLLMVVLLFGTGQAFLNIQPADFLPLSFPLALVAGVSLFLWQMFAPSPLPLSPATQRADGMREAVSCHLGALRVLALLSLGATLQLTNLASTDVVLAAATFLFIIAAELMSACRQQSETRVWIAQAVAVAAISYFAYFRIVTFGRGMAMFVVLGVGFVMWLMGEWARGRRSLSIVTAPLQRTALAMPALAVAIGLYRHLFMQPVWLGANSLALLLAAAFYFWRGLERQSKPFIIASTVILNAALAFLWRELDWTDPQFFMIPIGISILVFVQLLKQEIAEKFHNPLRYVGALVILVSPTFHIVGGSWLHLFSLMLASVAIVLVAMGLRVRALMYTGTAFLVADLIAMVVRGSIDDPNVLWIAGLALGAAVIALAAVCERNREDLLDRMRVLSEALRQWD
jgi:hypothetical protein